MRTRHAALRRGKQVARSYDDTAPGLVSFSRIDAETDDEYFLAFNTSAEALKVNSSIGYSARSIETLHGSCPDAVLAPGSVALDLPAFGWCIAKVSEAAE